MMNWQSTMPYMHDLMNLPQGPANVPQTYDPFAGSTPQPDLPPAPPMPYAQNNNMYQPVNPVWNTVSPNPFAGGGSGAWDAWIASMNQNGGMQTSAPIGPPMGAPAAAPAPQPAAQPIMEPGMGGIPPAPRPAGNGLSAPLGGGMGMAPRNEPGIGPGGMGMARPPTGMNGMAGPRPSEPFRPMSNPAMPQITPGNKVPMFPGAVGGSNFIRGRQLPVRRTLFNQRTNSQEIPLLASMFSASGQDPESAFGEFREFLPKGNKAPLTAF